MADLEHRVEQLEVSNERIRLAIWGNGEPGMKQDVALVASNVQVLVKGFDEFRESVKEQHDALWKRVSGRPSWTVTILLTVLSSACVGLLVAHFSR